MCTLVSPDNSIGSFVIIFYGLFREASEIFPTLLNEFSIEVLKTLKYSRAKRIKKIKNV